MPALTSDMADSADDDADTLDVGSLPNGGPSIPYCRVCEAPQQHQRENGDDDAESESDNDDDDNDYDDEAKHWRWNHPGEFQEVQRAR